MKIDFSITPADYQKARKLHLLLEHLHCSETDPDLRNLVEELIQQIDEYLASPELKEKLKLDEGNAFEATPRSPVRIIRTLLDGLFGPSNHELVLSRQRKELIGRAEHAENIAFQALADSSELKKELEDTLQKLRELEKQSGQGSDNSGT